jgi:hypothetical protein
MVFEKGGQGGIQEIALATRIPWADEQAFWSHDGTTCALAFRGYDRAGGGDLFTFHDPEHNRGGTLRRYSSAVWFNGTRMRKVTGMGGPRDITATMLPVSAGKQEHLIRLPDDRTVYLIVGAYEHSLVPCRAFIARGDTLAAVPVEYDADPDLGSMVKIKGHELWLGTAGEARWDGTLAERLDLGRHAVDYRITSVRVSLR